MTQPIQLTVARCRSYGGLGLALTLRVRFSALDEIRWN